MISRCKAGRHQESGRSPKGGGVASAGNPRLCLVHDYLNQSGGAEQVLVALHEAFPGVPIYTTMAERSRIPRSLQAADIRVSFAQRLPGITDHHRLYLPVYPFAVRSLDLRAYDIVLSSSSAFAKACRTRTGAIHLCYCHTPMRFAWRTADYLAHERMGMAPRLAIMMAASALRRWDVATSAGVTRFIANSTVVRQRICDCYQRDADVVFPPVDTQRFPVREGPAVGPFLVVSRLVAYKRLDLAVEACTRNGWELDVVGTGPDEPRLKAMAGSGVRFHGRLADEAVAAMMRRARLLIFPGEEDFGIVPLEATVSGCPVVAFRAGGALDTIREGINGLFFDSADASSLADALRRAAHVRWDPAAMRRHGLRFSKERFIQEIRTLVDEEWRRHTTECGKDGRIRHGHDRERSG